MAVVILDIFLPGELSNPLNGSHRHWSVRARWAKIWRTKTHLLVSARPEVRGLDSTAPKIIRFVANLWNLMDEGDGIRAALKPVLDGLRDARVIHSDGPGCGHLFVYGQRIDRRQRGVRILVEPNRENP